MDEAGGKRASGHMGHEETIDALEVELARTVALAERAPAGLAIPTCPGWNAPDLWQHLGQVHRWVTEIVRTRASEPIRRRDIDARLPQDGLWAPWLAEGGDMLLAALRDTAPGDPMWTWGEGNDAGWWARRQLHETVVHDADAALALGERFEVDGDVAADGICELLDNLPVRLEWPGAVVPTATTTVHLHATDADGLRDAEGEWMITLADGTVSYSHEHGKGDAAVRGPLSELMLLVNRRVDADTAALEVFGDEAALGAALDSLALQ